MLTKLKKRVQSWIATQAKWTHDVGLTPNQVSAVGIILAAISGLTYWQAKANPFFLIVAPIILLLSGYCDALDGALARLHGKTTTLGGFLDSLLDRYADAFILCGIILGGLCHPFWGLVALIGSLLVSYARARAEAAGVKMEAVGIAERAERLMILALASFLNVIWSEILGWSVILLAFLTHVTVLQRAVHFRKVSR